MLRSIDDDSPGAERLQQWNRRFTPLVVVAALLPLGSVLSGGSGTGAQAWLAVGSWLVLLIDLIAHIRLRPGFLSLPAGKLYVVIVVITTPVYLLLPGSAGNADLLTLARLAWVVRLIAVAVQGMRGIHRLLSRLGQTALYALVATLLAAIVIDQVESPADGFDDFGDALWWSIVTITSVGYGDLVPETTTGRITASLLMVAGLAFLGAIAATLASFLGLADASRSTDTPDVQPVAADRDPAATDRQVSELAELRREITRLAALIDDRHPPDETSGRRS